MKTIQKVVSVAAKGSEAVELVFQFEDGTKETLLCPLDRLSDVIRQVSAFNMNRAAQQSPQPQGDLVVSYQRGTSRVNLGIPTTGGVMHIMMGHDRAEKLGHDLVDAAHESTVSESKN